MEKMYPLYLTERQLRLNAKALFNERRNIFSEIMASTDQNEKRELRKEERAVRRIHTKISGMLMDITLGV